MNPLALRTLHDLRARYLALPSYEDVGSVVHEGKEILSFRTEFHRASRRLAFSARAGDRMLCDLDAVDLRVTRRQVADALTRCVPDDGELDRVLAALTGVTWGAAHTVPRLLFGRVLVGNCVADANAPTLLGRGIFDGEECHVVDLGPDWRGSIVAMGVESSALRRKSIVVRRAGDATQSPVTDIDDAWLARSGMVIRYSPRP
ncbi:MAG: hypothetical protein U0183_16220 [Polyangiaceae bacterium]